jgi:hypothetical protein
MDMDAFEAHAHQIAAALGADWTARRRDDEWINCATVTHADGRALKLRRMEDGARMVVTGVFPVTDYPYKRRETPKLTVALSRPAPETAEEITAEVMPTYETTLANVRAYNARYAPAA